MERLALILPEDNRDSEGAPLVFVAALGDAARRLALGWVTALRRRGVPAAMDYEGRSLKSQMRRADRMGAGHVLLAGDDELKAGQLLLRDMGSKDQQEIPVDTAVDKICVIVKNV
jgi:histidyl-tRNA synthetase